MPYKIKKQGSSYVVSKKESGKPIQSTGHFKTRREAVQQMRAVYANEKK